MKVRNLTNILLCLTIGASFAFTVSCKGKKKKKNQFRTAHSINNQGSDDAKGETEETSGEEATETGSQQEDNVLLLTSNAGLKSGTQTYNTYLKATGLENSQTLRDAYDELADSLPGQDHLVREFSAAHQSALAKLAAVFCDEMTSDATARLAIAPDAVWQSTPTNIGAQGLDSVSNGLFDAFWGAGYEDSARNQQYPILIGLYNELKAEVANTPEGNRRAIAGLCVAVATSFPTLLQ